MDILTQSNAMAGELQVASDIPGLPAKVRGEENGGTGVRSRAPA